MSWRWNGEAWEMPWREYLRPLMVEPPEDIPWNLILGMAPMCGIVPGYPQAPIERIVAI